MRLMCTFAVVCLVGLTATEFASAQESMAAKVTRKRLQETIVVDQKDVGTKDFLEEVLGEINVKFIIDNGSGVSNNTKMTYKGKVTAEKMLSDLADKYDWGWYVVSEASNNKIDGKVKIRKNTKAKERGYEAGKEPKKTSWDGEVLPRALTTPVRFDPPRWESVYDPRPTMISRPV